MISVKQDQYSTYIITEKDSLSRLEIVPERGGMVTRWKIQGQDILYLDEERFANPEQSVRGGIPILFPICGNLPDNHYTFNGKEYTLKQHGFARDLPWQVRNNEGKNATSLTLVLQSNAQTRAVYPFDFELAFTYEIKANSLIIKQRFQNNSEERMPFSVGLHPYFFIVEKNGLQFDIPASQYQDQNTQEVSSFEGNFDFAKREIDVAFKSLSRQSASFSHAQRRLRVTIEYSELYSTLVFWTVQGKDYICLEPWSAPRNALNTAQQLSYLAPGSSQYALVSIKVNHF